MKAAMMYSQSLRLIWVLGSVRVVVAQRHSPSAALARRPAGVVATTGRLLMRSTPVRVALSK
jgi:hypothetical protein